MTTLDVEMAAKRRLNLVVAACNKQGIGVDGHLPWRLKGDMAFFKRITLETKNSNLKNAVIMGRKTWESIPGKFRPLQGRINIVISQNWQEAPNGAHLANSLTEAVNLCDSEKLTPKIEEIFVIGGSSIYQLAMNSSHPLRVYFTRIHADIKCDTFFQELDPNVFKRTQIDGVDTEEKEENGMKYQFEVYERP